eukprot:CAMPEP_0185182130 /NCGR_PEP_ID=MMETSP1140-20130426/1144_1 /TAXON_ID=298111 /ORGANISM="Pavlova sp., Strain CCMP459" /LENGTH=121 /DNA_ID=CAMNT_0027748051 /DNA_START=161 /DNA_END=523 /DNA_ORIENTATION=-
MLKPFVYSHPLPHRRVDLEVKREEDGIHRAQAPADERGGGGILSDAAEKLDLLGLGLRHLNELLGALLSELALEHVDDTHRRVDAESPSEGLRANIAEAVAVEVELGHALVVLERVCEVLD